MRDGARRCIAYARDVKEADTLSRFLREACEFHGVECEAADCAHFTHAECARNVVRTELRQVGVDPARLAAHRARGGVPEALESCQSSSRRTCHGWERAQVLDAPSDALAARSRVGQRSLDIACRCRQNPLVKINVTKVHHRPLARAPSSAWDATKTDS